MANATTGGDDGRFGYLRTIAPPDLVEDAFQEEAEPAGVDRMRRCLGRLTASPPPRTALCPRPLAGGNRQRDRLRRCWCSPNRRCCPSGRNAPCSHWRRPPPVANCTSDRTPRCSTGAATGWRRRNGHCGASSGSRQVTGTTSKCTSSAPVSRCRPTGISRHRSGLRRGLAG
jgi:hypothetical protein